MIFLGIALLGKPFVPARSSDIELPFFAHAEVFRLWNIKQPSFGKDAFNVPKQELAYMFSQDN